MKMTRRGFLAAGLSLVSGDLWAKELAVWNSRFFAADISVSVPVPMKAKLEADLPALQGILDQLKSNFSLYHDDSFIVLLNKTGKLNKPSWMMLDLLQQIQSLHQITSGQFDPTIQPLWSALAWGKDEEEARALIGFENVIYSKDRVRFSKPRQALSMNGIVQGYATDLVTQFLKSQGYISALVNIGEFSSIGGRWQVGVENTDYDIIHQIELADSALATSTPFSMMLGEVSHILPIYRHQEVVWKTVTVEADSATFADGLSTGLAYATLSQIKSIGKHPKVRSILVENIAGEITFITNSGTELGG